MIYMVYTPIDNPTYKPVHKDFDLLCIKYLERGTHDVDKLYSYRVKRVREGSRSHGDNNYRQK